MYLLIRLYALAALYAAALPNSSDWHSITSWAMIFGTIAMLTKRILQPDVEPVWASVVSANVRTIILVIIAGVGPAATILATSTSWQDGITQALWAAVLGISGALGADHVLPASGTLEAQKKFAIRQAVKDLEKKP